MRRRRTFLIVATVVLLVTTSVFAWPYSSPDLTNDRFVDFADFAKFAQNWQELGDGLEGDFDESNSVDVNDLLYISSYWLEEISYAPVACDQNVSLVQGSSTDITLEATDADGDPLVYFMVDYPSHGQTVLDANAANYKPLESYHDNDSFTFIVFDGQLESNIATVSITVLPDGDGDGLSDYDEINGTFGYVTDPCDIHSDADNMPDGWEINNGLNPTIDDSSSDADNDGLNNGDEYSIGTNPQDTDSDDDGLSDGDEVNGTFSSYGPVWPYNNSYPTYYYTVYAGQSYDIPTDPTSVDSDGDNVKDGKEIQWGINPNNSDSDGDGLTDGYEVYFGYHSYDVYRPFPLWNYLYGEDFDDCDLNTNDEDTDSDGMLDGWEAPHACSWLDPRYKGSGSFQDINYDPDGDSLVNYQEHYWHTNPTYWDTDGDGLSDGEERGYWGYYDLTNPTLFDTDGDGLVDGYNGIVSVSLYPQGISSGRNNYGYNGYVWGELTCSTDPASKHTDSDNMSDGWETDHWNGYAYNYFDPADDCGYTADDFDGDNLTNYQEYLNNLDPWDSDTDNDNLNDGYEVNTSLTDPKNNDCDNDGLLDGAEINTYSTDPFEYDTDGDLLPDGWEANNGLSPTNTTGDNGQNGDPDNDGLINFDELVYGTNPQQPDSDGDNTNDGDEVAQGSNPADGSDGGQAPEEDTFVYLKLTMGDHSGSHSERYNLKVGSITHQAPEHGVVEERAYPFEIGKKYEIEIVHIDSNQSPPDYDYTALIEPNDTLPEGVSLVIDDADGILGVHGESDYFYAQNKKAYLYLTNAKFYLYADEGGGEEDKYGHSWWQLTIDAECADLIDDELEPYINSGGWWPDNSDPNLVTYDPLEGNWVTYAPGDIYFGSGASGEHNPTGNGDWPITLEGLNAALQYIKDLDESGKYWSVYAYNCTDVAILVGEAAGKETLSPSGPLTSPKALSDWLDNN